MNDPNPSLVLGLLGPETGLHGTQRDADILGWLYATIYLCEHGLKIKGHEKLWREISFLQE